MQQHANAATTTINMIRTVTGTGVTGTGVTDVAVNVRNLHKSTPFNLAQIAFIAALVTPTATVLIWLMVVVVVVEGAHATMLNGMGTLLRLCHKGQIIVRTFNLEGLLSVTKLSVKRKGDLYTATDVKGRSVRVRVTCRS